MITKKKMYNEDLMLATSWLYVLKNLSVTVSHVKLSVTSLLSYHTPCSDSLIIMHSLKLSVTRVLIFIFWILHNAISFVEPDTPWKCLVMRSYLAV